jgi:hypothetical protein
MAWGDVTGSTYQGETFHGLAPNEDAPTLPGLEN